MGDSRPSASPTSAIGNKFYVFLSFRGADTRKGFTDHLYHRLVDVGLPFHPNFVFRDDDELRMGEPVDDGLFTAIDHSKVSIPVISERYADSKWCLQELIHIMKCHQSRGQIVLPVLYKVKTEDVKYMKGPFGAAFHSKTRFSDEFKKEAKEALEKALELRVYKSDENYSGEEARLVKELVEEIRCHLQRDFPTYRPVDLVGFDDHVAKVMNLADTAFSETRIIVIHGTGGVGKTTLVTTIYERLFQQFQWHSFLKDIRQTIERKDMQYVQSLLTSDLTKGSERAVRHSDIGIGYIQQASKGKKVLMVLDDVDCREHLDKLIDGCEFESGSRIFITCRNKTLLKSEYKEHELQKMNPTDSLLLFNRYAFDMKQPSEELAALSSKIVDTTGGLPLALVTIGSILKDKDTSIWIETLEKLKKVPNEDVQKVLRISYDSLGYGEQQMFLDIACFFIGIDKRIATYLWDDLKIFPTIGLKALIDRSLIIDDVNNELRMHVHLRDLGRAIACPMDKKPWDCSRLWDEEAITIQRSKEENRNIEALSLDKKGSRKFMEQCSYKRMPYLKFLRMSKVNFVGNFKDSLSELRWLEWEMCPDFFMATNVHLEKLLLLDLSDGFISENWRGWNSIKMERLKFLNLSGCSHLKGTPNLSALKKLERLILENCQNLEEIGPSIGDVKCLVSLNLRDCRKLKRLPAPQLGELENLEELLVDRTGITNFPGCIKSLEKLKTLTAVGCGQLTVVPTELGEVKGLISLNLRACDKLAGLPEEIGKLEELKEINISGTAINKLPQSIGCLKKLEMLDAYGCKSLDVLPDSIGGLVSLSTLDLRCCHKLGKLPESIGCLVKLQRLLLNETLRLPNGNDNARVEDPIPDSIGWLEWLTELHLSRTGISKLPEPIGDLKNLKILRIAHCERLTTLPSTIRKLGKLEELHASNCTSLEGEIPIVGMSSLRILQLDRTLVSSFPDDIDKLSSLEKLNLTGCKMLRSLPQSIGKLPSLQQLDLTSCEKLRSLPELPASLTVLKVACQHRTLPRLSHLIHLKELAVEHCPSLESMPELPLGLLELRVNSCGKLQELPSLSSLGSLSLTVKNCGLLKSMPELPSRLLKLHVDSCGKLEELPSLSSLGYLSELYLNDCKEVTKIEGLEGLKSLAKLVVAKCPKLSNLDGLKHLESLRQLDISDSPLVNDGLVRGLDRLKNLEKLRTCRCVSLVKPDLSQFTRVEDLCTPACTALVEIVGLERLTNLKNLDIRLCTSIDIGRLPNFLCFKNLRTFYPERGMNLDNIRGLNRNTIRTGL